MWTLSDEFTLIIRKPDIVWHNSGSHRFLIVLGGVLNRIFANPLGSIGIDLITSDKSFGGRPRGLDAFLV